MSSYEVLNGPSRDLIYDQMKDIGVHIPPRMVDMTLKIPQGIDSAQVCLFVMVYDIMQSDWLLAFEVGECDPDEDELMFRCYVTGNSWNDALGDSFKGSRLEVRYNARGRKGTAIVITPGD